MAETIGERLVDLGKTRVLCVILKIFPFSRLRKGCFLTTIFVSKNQRDADVQHSRLPFSHQATSQANATPNHFGD